ncbi:two-component system, cell cycle response regulator [Gammaproteobacteria bacterium]
MSSPFLSLQEKIARLRHSFIEQLPLRMAEIDQLFQTVTVDPEAPAKPDLLRQLHSLKGTSATFGLQSLSHRTLQLEDQLKQHLGNDLTEPSQATLHDLLSALRTEIRCLVQGGMPCQEEARIPAFDPAITPVVRIRSDSAQPLIYLCDDDPYQLEQLGTQLQCFGYQIHTFASTALLRQAALNCWPDMVIMEIVFPDGHDAGIHFTQDLQRHALKPLLTVFISGRCDFEARLLAVQAGGVAYFQKPVKVMDLVEIIDAHVVQHHKDPMHILVINDEPDEAAYHAAILEEAGMKVRITNLPETVLDVMADFKPDLLLMDMYMPRCSGQDLARVIRQIPYYLSLPIVYLSGETDTQAQFSAMRAGADGFLTKPILPEVLVSAVMLRSERMRVLRSLMTRDSLTGLLNHTETKQSLSLSVYSARRNGSQVCLAILDVDHFKRINDTYGHAVGDQVLLALARILQQRLRKSDIVGRIGGEEFAVILHEVDLAQAVKLIEALREDFAKVRFYSRSGAFFCTFSGGVSDLSSQSSAETLFEGADQALYWAKHAGRNRVLAFQTDATEDLA